MRLRKPSLEGADEDLVLISVSGEDDVLDRRVQVLHQMHAFPVVVRLHSITLVHAAELRLCCTAWTIPMLLCLCTVQLTVDATMMVMVYCAVTEHKQLIFGFNVLERLA